MKPTILIIIYTGLSDYTRNMRYEVVTVVRMTMLFFWIETPCRLVGRYQRFGEIALKMETVCFSETVVST
jgi:hypothetical protein